MDLWTSEPCKQQQPEQEQQQKQTREEANDKWWVHWKTQDFSMLMIWIHPTETMILILTRYTPCLGLFCLGKGLDKKRVWTRQMCRYKPVPSLSLHILKSALTQPFPIQVWSIGSPYNPVYVKLSIPTWHFSSKVFFLYGLVWLHSLQLFSGEVPWQGSSARSPKPCMSYQLGMAIPPLRDTGCVGAVGNLGFHWLVVSGGKKYDLEND